MKQKTKSILMIFLLVILVALIGISFYGEIFFQTVFPDELTTANIKITNQNGQLNFLEGDTINPISTETMGIKGYMIFVNDKLHKISGSYANTPHYSICGTASTSEVYWENDCGSFQYAYKNLLRCSNDNICDYPRIEKLEAGNNQEVEVIMSLSKNDGGIIQQYNRFKINVASLPCVLDTGQSIVAQTYQSNSILNKNSLRYKDAFVKTCSSLPPIIVDSFTKTSYTDLNILTKFNSNFDYQVDSRRVMAFFYVVDNSKAQLSLVCDINKAFNIDTNRCEDINAFVSVCQEGVINPEQGTCTVIPELDYLCPEGSRYDTVLNSCIANIDQIKCNVEGAVYDLNLKVCIYTPKTEGLCLEGNFDKEKNVCILTENLDYLCLKGNLVDINGTKTCQIIPENDYICKKGFTYDNELGKCVKPYEEKKFNILYITIPSILIILTLIIYLFSKKSRKR